MTEMERTESELLLEVDVRKKAERIAELKKQHDKRAGWFFRKLLGEPPYHVWKWKLLTTPEGHYISKGTCEVCGIVIYDINPRISQP